MTPLTDLLRRVEGAAGPDRKIDADIVRQFGTVRAGTWWWAGDTQAFARADMPELTSSVDAALALVERVLPGWIFTIARHYGHDNPTGPFYADVASAEWIQDAPGSAGQQAEAYGATPALAILAALLKILIARSGSSQSSVPARC